MRQLKRADYNTDHEFEQAKRQRNKADKGKRQSSTGRRSFEQGE
ncbi:hypothetical protein Roomu2_00098 [Pseudomonas phage vB_PpuM-Roomu-2]|uniref:Uncharacterized protein n=1 Tax=Pseudomonas phage vB_PpuM-Roomu-2 TaxID=3132621 RepID=A0AAX4MYK1_9CAUD